MTAIVPFISLEAITPRVLVSVTADVLTRDFHVDTTGHLSKSELPFLGACDLLVL